jgi:hypothetical protein
VRIEILLPSGDCQIVEEDWRNKSEVVVQFQQLEELTYTSIWDDCVGI